MTASFLHLQDHPAEECELCSGRLAAAVWEKLEATPGFNEEMEQAEADLAAGLGTPFREARRNPVTDDKTTTTTETTKPAPPPQPETTTTTVTEPRADEKDVEIEPGAGKPAEDETE